MSIESYINKRIGNFNSPYYNDGIRGQCVWYVRGRAKEKVGVDTGIRGDAKTWYTQATHKGKSLRSDSIACFGGGNFGHVIYIELVENGNVYYTEANANADNRLSSDDGILKKSTVSQFMTRKGYQGCIYLMDYKSKKKSSPLTTAVLHYRESPNGKIIGTLPCGSNIVFADKSKVTVGGYVWREIIIDGKSYYSADKYIEY